MVTQKLAKIKIQENMLKGVVYSVKEMLPILMPNIDDNARLSKSMNELFTRMENVFNNKEKTQNMGLMIKNMMDVTKTVITDNSETKEDDNGDEKKSDSEEESSEEEWY